MATFDRVTIHLLNLISRTIYLSAVIFCLAWAMKHGYLSPRPGERPSTGGVSWDQRLPPYFHVSVKMSQNYLALISRYKIKIESKVPSDSYLAEIVSNAEDLIKKVNWPDEPVWHFAEEFPKSTFNFNTWGYILIQ